MDKDKIKDLVKKFGTAGMNVYVHDHCKDLLLEKIKADGKVIEDDRSINWKPKDLIGKYKDITRCDICGKEFVVGDQGYFSSWVTSPEELEAWNEIQKEKNTSTR